MKKTKLILPIVTSTAVVATLPIALTSCGQNVSTALDKDSGSNTWSSFQTYSISKRNTYIFTLKDSKGFAGRMLSVSSACSSSGGSKEFVSDMKLDGKINNISVKFESLVSGTFSVEIPSQISSTSDLIVQLHFGLNHENAVTMFMIS